MSYGTGLLSSLWMAFILCLFSVYFLIYFGSSNMEQFYRTKHDYINIHRDESKTSQSRPDKQTDSMLHALTPSTERHPPAAQRQEEARAMQVEEIKTDQRSSRDHNENSELTETTKRAGVTKVPPHDRQQKPTNARIAARNMDKKNVLFIVADDLRPQLNCYRGPYYPDPGSRIQMHTPNLDALAARSLLLTRAYAQYSLCAPSRTSFLTGRRPDTTKVWDLVTYWRISGGNFTTLPQYFKDSGYTTAATGKIFHGGTSARHFDQPSWSIRYKRPKHGSYWNNNVVKDSWRAVNVSARLKVPLPDQEIVAQAVSHLRDFAPAAREGKNFFLGVGFHKPHLPFVFPDEYLALYPLDDMEAPSNNYSPYKLPNEAFNPPHELSICEDIKRLELVRSPNQTFPEHTIKQLRRAYFCCVSYIDDLVGQVLGTLQELGLTNSTIVTFIGDHGWHLGENGQWGKRTNFEQGTHSPMMIHIPNRTNHGIRSDSIVELLDLFPTIVEASGLGSLPSCPNVSSGLRLCSEGTSILPLIDDPQKDVKPAAFSQMIRKGIMGYSIRTDGYRYTEWVPLRITKQQEDRYDYDILWHTKHGAELYDHQSDPMENINRIDSADLAPVRISLSLQLQEQFNSKILNTSMLI